MAEIKADIVGIKADIANMEANLKREIVTIYAETKADIIKWVVGLFLTNSAMMVGMFAYFQSL